jgi:hypothetical protein
MQEIYHKLKRLSRPGADERRIFRKFSDGTFFRLAACGARKERREMMGQINEDMIYREYRQKWSIKSING